MIVDLDKAVEIVDKVIADAAKDDIHHYKKPGRGWSSGCYYVHRYREDGGFVSCETEGPIATVKPGCIVGRVVLELGVPIEWIDWNMEGVFQRDGYLVYALKTERDINFTSKAHVFLRKIQSLQDQGCDWVTARHEALNHVRECL